MIHDYENHKLHELTRRENAGTYQQRAMKNKNPL